MSKAKVSLLPDAIVWVTLPSERVKIALLAPPRALSEVPGNGARSFASYNVSVHKNGFAPLALRRVPVFDGITSVQPADLIPLAENGYPDSFKPYGGPIDEGEALGTP